MEYAIAFDPTIGDVVPDLGGIRKLRFAIGNRGKRGDVLVILLCGVDKPSQERDIKLAKQMAKEV